MLWLDSVEKTSTVYETKFIHSGDFWALIETSPFSVPPSIVYIFHDTLANEADDVKLFCNSTGNPRANIAWTFLNGSNSRIIRTGETLVLSNVTRNQAGTYKCTATNGIMVPATANVQVTINCKYDISQLISWFIRRILCHAVQCTCTVRIHLWDIGLSTIGVNGPIRKKAKINTANKRGGKN